MILDYIVLLLRGYKNSKRSTVQIIHIYFVIWYHQLNKQKITDFDVSVSALNSSKGKPVAKTQCILQSKTFKFSIHTLKRYKLWRLAKLIIVFIQLWRIVFVFHLAFTSIIACSCVYVKVTSIWTALFALEYTRRILQTW